MPTILSVVIALLFLLCSSYVFRRQTSRQRARSNAGYTKFPVQGAGGAIRGRPSLVDDWIAPILVCTVALVLVLSLVWFSLSPAD